MYTHILFYLAMSICPDVIKINHSSCPWDKHDDTVIARATARCPQIFKDNECLIKIVKVSCHDYKVVCGEPRNTGDPLDKIRK